MKKFSIIDWFWIDEDLKIKAIRTSQSGSWYARYNLPGVGQRKQSLKTASKRQAKLNGYALARRIAGGEMERERKNTATVAQAIEARRQRLIDLGRMPAILVHYDRIYARLVNHLPAGGDTRLVDLTSSALERFERTLRDTGISRGRASGKPRRPHKPKPLRSRTLLHTMQGVFSLVRFALRRGMIDRDPTVGYEMPRATRRSIVTFTPEELAAIYRDTDTAMGEIWRFLTLTCLRSNELCWLTKDDVIRDDNNRPTAIRIRSKTCPYTKEAWRPKHNIERVVPLAPEAADVLTRAMARSRMAWVFEAPDTKSGQAGRWDAKRLLMRFKSRLRASGIDHGYLHLLRHTGATFLANDARVPIAHVQRLLGHTTIQTTNRYLHTRAEDVAESITRVDYARLTSPSTAVNNGAAAPGRPTPRAEK